MTSPECVTEKMCAERHKNLTQNTAKANEELNKKVDEIRDEVLKIRLLWMGNGKPGAGHKIETMWTHYSEKQKSTQGLIDWAFRAVITVLVSYIAIKIGIK